MTPHRRFTPHLAGSRQTRFRPLWRAAALTAAVVGVSTALAACGSDTESTASGSSPSAAGVQDIVGPTTPVFAKGGELNIYSWPDYFGEKNLAEFKRKTGIKINIATYESNEDMFAKMNTSARSSYDLVVPTSQYIKTMADLKLIQPLDQAKIPWQNIDPELLGKTFDPKNEYSAPKTFGTTGFLYDPTVTGQDFTTYADVIALAKQPEFSGRLNLPDGGKGLLDWGMQALGLDRNSTNIEDWKKAADYLIKDVVPHANAFGGTFDYDPVVSGKIWGMSTDSSVARRALIEHPQLKYVLLKPQTELWVDNFVVVNGSKNLDQVYSFLSYFLNDKVMVRETSQIGYATALVDAKSKLDPSVKHPEVIFPTAEQYKGLVPTELDQDIQGEIDKLANQVKAAAA